MRERHRGDGSESFDWLYGTPDKGVGSDDPTELLPGQPRAGSDPPGDTSDTGDTGDTEHTRVLGRPVPPAGPPPSARRPETPPMIAPTPGGPPPGQPPKGAESGGEGGGGRRWKIRPFRILALLLALWLAYLVAVPFFAWQKVSKVDAEPDGARPGDQPGTTYLLVGSDSREGLTKNQKRRLATGNAAGKRTDTIMLLHTGDGPNLLMSIPRDSLVDVPGHGTTKINAAYALGGPQLLVQTLEKATGIRVDDYVEIGFGGFVKMVNAVDGITICPKRDMTDPLAGLKVKAGCQHAGGRKALAYARSRHSQQLGDIDRAANQREVVAAIGAEAFGPSTFLNPFRYYDLSFASADSINVGDNVGPVALANFANAMRKVTGDEGLTCGVPISDLAVHWDPERSKRMFRLIREDRTSEIGKGLCQTSGLQQ